MSIAKRIGYFVVTLFVLAQSGCLFLGASAVGGGAVGVAYLAGKATRTVDASLDETSMAVGSALRDLGLPIVDSHGTRIHAEVNGRLASGESLTIDLDEEARAFSTDPARTKVSIRIGEFGDQKLSKRILEQIDERLKNPAPPPPAGASPPLAPRPAETGEPPMAK